MPRVSVITPVYNCRPHLAETVASVFAQTYADWELLLADDGSRDGSAELAREYARRHAGRVTYLEHAGHRNRGVSATRNLAIRHARGEFLAMLDGDDVWLPGKLELQVRAADARPATGLIYAQASYIDAEGRPLAVPAFGQGDPSGPAWYFDRLVEEVNFIPASTVVVRRECLSRAGLFEEGLQHQIEDWLLWSRLAGRVPFLFLPSPLVRYRCRRGSFCQGLDQYRWVSAVGEWLAHVFRGNPRQAAHRRAVRRHWARAMLPAAHYYAESGQGWQAVRTLLLLVMNFDASVTACASFHAAWVKALLGRRGLALVQRLRNRQRPAANGLSLGPRA